MPCPFAGLPEEFSPPERAAARIAELRTAPEREALFIRTWWNTREIRAEYEAELAARRTHDRAAMGVG